jgi:hypothetical protein
MLKELFYKKNNLDESLKKDILLALGTESIVYIEIYRRLYNAPNFTPARFCRSLNQLIDEGLIRSEYKISQVDGLEVGQDYYIRVFGKTQKSIKNKNPSPPWFSKNFYYALMGSIASFLVSFFIHHSSFGFSLAWGVLSFFVLYLVSVLLMGRPLR